MPDVPLRFADTPAGIDRLPPRLGEHGHDILREAGLSEREIDALAAQGGLMLSAGKDEPVT
jgi:crotonobetainyl-CoA:carnitine CoA-transferase CaiB-like acyl-CoA transferase